MSNQAGTRDQPLLVACCSPLAGEPLGPARATELSRAFKALGDPARLRLLSLIASHPGGEACVCDLSGGFDLAGPTISHHLKVLRDAGLLTSERRASWVYYAVVPEVMTNLSAVLSTAGVDVTVTTGAPA